MITSMLVGLSLWIRFKFNRCCIIEAIVGHATITDSMLVWLGLCDHLKLKQRLRQHHNRYENIKFYVLLCFYHASTHIHDTDWSLDGDHRLKRYLARHQQTKVDLRVVEPLQHVSKQLVHRGCKLDEVSIKFKVCFCEFAGYLFMTLSVKLIEVLGVKKLQFYWAKVLKNALTQFLVKHFKLLWK